jgi:hypothetical protein
MKKTKLLIDYDFDFVIIGITSSLKAYKLAWELNKHLSLHLVRKEDVVIGVKAGGERIFSSHVHQTASTHIRFLVNKSQDADGKYFLAPEFPHADFLFVTHGAEQSIAENLLKAIRKIPSVELAAFIPLESLKSKDNFIF